MNAKEARNIVKEQEERERKEAEANREKREKDITKTKQLAIKNWDRYVDLIHDKIRAAAHKKEKKCKHTIIYRDKEYGSYYLEQLNKILKKQLEANSYKYIGEVRVVAGTIFEGLMNPEAVGFEYEHHALDITLEW